jgi:hypothetical protein
MADYGEELHRYRGRIMLFNSLKCLSIVNSECTYLCSQMGEMKIELLRDFCPTT